MSIILPKLESFLYLLVSRIPFPDSGFQIPAFPYAQCETPGNGYISELYCSRREFGTVEFCKDTAKSAGDAKKNRILISFHKTTCCCLAPM